MERHGIAEQGIAGVAWQGRDGTGIAGKARQGVARQGVAGQVIAGMARLGRARPGWESQARRGLAWRVTDLPGKAPQAWHGVAVPGEAGLGTAGQAWRGGARHGRAPQARTVGRAYQQRAQQTRSMNMSEAKTRKIRTLHELADLALSKKSVFVPSMQPWKKCRPAAFVMSLQGQEIFKMLNAGMFVYSPKQSNTFSSAVRHNK